LIVFPWESVEFFLKWWKKTGFYFSAVYYALNIPLVCKGKPGFRSVSVDDVADAFAEAVFKRFCEIPSAPPLALTIQLWGNELGILFPKNNRVWTGCPLFEPVLFGIPLFCITVWLLPISPNELRESW
jgi:hypothetical protein